MKYQACQGQYADDVMAFLPDEAALPAFLQAMQMFGDASGQRLHPASSQAMLLGARTLPPLPPQSPVRLVRTAEALGVTFREILGPPTADWQAHTFAVLSRFNRLAALPLSALGVAWPAQLMASAASFSTQSLLACRRQWRLPRSPGQLLPLWTLALRLGGQQVGAFMGLPPPCFWAALGQVALACCP